MRHPFIMRPGASYSIATGTSEQPAAQAVSPGVTAVRLVATVACEVSLTTGNPATTGSMYLVPNYPEYFEVSSGQTISAISATAGNLYITELSR